MNKIEMQPTNEQDRDVTILDALVMNKLDYKAKNVYVKTLDEENPTLQRAEISLQNTLGIQVEEAVKLNKKSIVLNDTLKTWSLAEPDDYTFCRAVTVRKMNIIVGVCHYQKLLKNTVTTLDEKLMLCNACFNTFQSPFSNGVMC